jgi:hypothetical protein
MAHSYTIKPPETPLALYGFTFFRLRKQQTD